MFACRCRCSSFVQHNQPPIPPAHFHFFPLSSSLPSDHFFLVSSADRSVPFSPLGELARVAIFSPAFPLNSPPADGSLPPPSFFCSFAHDSLHKLCSLIGVSAADCVCNTFPLPCISRRRIIPPLIIDHPFPSRSDLSSLHPSSPFPLAIPFLLSLLVPSSFISFSSRKTSDPPPFSVRPLSFPNLSSLAPLSPPSADARLLPACSRSEFAHHDPGRQVPSSPSQQQRRPLGGPITFRNLKFVEIPFSEFI